MKLNYIQHPVLVLDENRCKKNILKISERVKSFDSDFRPHFKTHQSHTVGRWFREAGITGITVSSTSMAHYFANDGWDDITIAFPFFPAQINDLIALQKKARLRLFIHDPAHLELLNSSLMDPFQFVIETDAGYGRSGVHFENDELITDIIHTSEKLDKCTFHGFYIHDGRTYQARDSSEINKSVLSSFNALIDLKKQYPEAKLSLGDTPSVSVFDQFENIDEVTAGNFVFYDWTQATIGSCTPDEIALFVVLPLAQVIQNGSGAILHGGAAHLSKDYLQDGIERNFGQVILPPGHGTITPVKGASLTALSQEHGTLAGFDKVNAQYEDTEHIWLCPIHSCLTANLFSYYISSEGKRIEKRVLS